MKNVLWFRICGVVGLILHVECSLKIFSLTPKEILKFRTSDSVRGLHRCIPFRSFVDALLNLFHFSICLFGAVQGAALLRTTCGTPNYVAPEVHPLNNMDWVLLVMHHYTCPLQGRADLRFTFHF